MSATSRADRLITRFQPDNSVLRNSFARPIESAASTGEEAVDGSPSAGMPPISDVNTFLAWLNDRCIERYSVGLENSHPPEGLLNDLANGNAFLTVARESTEDGSTQTDAAVKEVLESFESGFVPVFLERLRWRETKDPRFADAMARARRQNSALVSELIELPDQSQAALLSAIAQREGRSTSPDSAAARSSESEQDQAAALVLLGALAVYAAYQFVQLVEKATCND